MALQKKNTARILAALRKGDYPSDRGQAVHDELLKTAPKDLAKALGEQSDLDSLAKTLKDLCKSNRIGWTASWTNKQKSKSKATVLDIGLALDSEHWAYPISESITPGESSVTLQAAEKGNEMVRNATSQEAPAAIIVLDEPIPSDALPEGVVARLTTITVISYKGNSTETVGKSATIYNLCAAKLIAQKKAPLELPVDLTAEVVICWLRITANFGDTTGMDNHWQEQFSGAAPVTVRSAKQATTDRRTAEQQRNKKSEERVILDKSLTKLFTDFLKAKFPTITPESGITRIMRSGSGDSRSLSVVVAFKALDAYGSVLPESGDDGFTYSIVFGGDSKAMLNDRDKYDLIYFPKNKITLRAAFALAKSLPDTLGAHYDSAKSRVGIRVKKGPTAAQTWKAVTGSSTVLSSRKWRVKNIPNNQATVGQMERFISLAAWTGAEIEAIYWSSRDKFNVAIVRAAVPPPSFHIKVSHHSSEILNIEEILAKNLTDNRALEPRIILASEVVPGASRRISSKSRPIAAPPQGLQPPPGLSPSAMGSAWIKSIKPAGVVTPAGPTPQVREASSIALPSSEAGDDAAMEIDGENSNSNDTTVTTASAAPTTTTSTTATTPDPRVPALEAQLADLKAKFHAFELAATTRADRADIQLTELAVSSNAQVQQLQAVRTDINASVEMASGMNNTLELLKAHFGLGSAPPSTPTETAKRPKLEEK
jgi:hypothetical protein